MGEFSVYQFFPDGTNEKVRENASTLDAVAAAIHYCTSVGAKLGTTRKVIITDSDDYVAFEWTFDDGITFGASPDKIGTLKKGIRP